MQRFANLPVRIDSLLMRIIIKSLLLFLCQNYEFVVYMTNDVTDVSDGVLRIKPILTNTKFGENFVEHGTIILEG